MREKGVTTVMDSLVRGGAPGGARALCPGVLCLLAFGREGEVAGGWGGGVP
jgi:hypothetical protein